MKNIFILIGLLWVLALFSFEILVKPIVNCDMDAYQTIDARVQSVDAQAHGPDLGSDEWKQVIQFKLGLRERNDVPSIHSTHWCQFIYQHLDALVTPTYDCQQAKLGTVARLICLDSQLASLDVKLANVFTLAQSKAMNGQLDLLTSQQKGWIKGRDDCWKSPNAKKCVLNIYQYRIAELQAQYTMVAKQGPMIYACEGRKANDVVVSFYDTTPKSLIAERGSRVSFMLSTPSAAGIKYKGRNELFSEHQGKAKITWGYDETSVTCQKISNED